MADQSKYGKWESQGEQVDAKLWDIASRHHAFPSVYGIQCMCGARPGTNRGFTEHVIDMTVKATAHVAEKRAEWEAEQSEPEWEWAVESTYPYNVVHSGWTDEETARTIAHWPITGGTRRLVRRRKAGPTLPVPNTTKEAIRSALIDNRDPECVKAWPGCHDFGYDPACCRFPKSCSAGGFEPVPDATNHETTGAKDV